ncbi:hypothetical protein RA27_02310 [Ruegeria sp. ANG-R]|nr:hypothetical protein RA27_02310 [Ruegeria sp. ANG-R]
MTLVGRNKEAAALANGTPLTITEIAWGDGDNVPNGGETELINELGRKGIQGSGSVPEALNTAFFEILLDVEEGPFVIREAGLFDSDGDLIAICYYDPPVNKPKDTVSALMRIHVVFSDLQNLILQVVGTDAYVPVERLISAGSGLLGGGDMGDDRSLAVDFASVAEARAGAISNKSISPATLKALIDDLLNGAPGALDTLNELSAALGDDPNFAATITSQLGQACPIGMEMYWTGNAPPSGWLEEDRSTILRASYPVLWAHVQVSGMLDATGADVGMFGPGDGVTSFQLPDGRAVVNRGWDHGRGLDVGRVFGSYQPTALPNIVGQSSRLASTDRNTDDFEGVFVPSDFGRINVDFNNGSQDGQVRFNFDASQGAVGSDGVTGSASGVYQNVDEARMHSNARMICIRAY